MGRTRTHTRHRPRSNPRGVIEVHPGGFGFVKTAEGEFFIPESKMAGAFDGDLVEVAPLPPSGAGNGRGRAGRAETERPEARVLSVIDRAHDVVVGRYEVAEPFGVVVPEDPRIHHDIFTLRAERPDIPDGALVRVRITTFPSRNTAATGVVEEVLGQADAASVPIEYVIARHKLETAFSEGSLAQARDARLDVAGALVDGYRDLRKRFIFTVDPADARDFDDAVSLERLDRRGPGDREGGRGRPFAQTVLSSRKSATGAFGSCGTRFVTPAAPGRSKGPDGLAVLGDLAADVPAEAPYVTTGIRVVDGRGLSAAAWRLGVHIADVSHYVPWGSSIDLDARRRATSVYLVDRVVPMLPEELSCDLCSLRPGEDRRTMTVDIYLDEAARPVAYEIYPALIRSSARLTYGQAQELLDADAGGDADAGEDGAGLEAQLAQRLLGLSAIAQRRAAAREARGGIDFDTAEARMQLDDQGRPVGVEVRRKTPATSLIEEAMILGNETVAAHLRDTDAPGIFRVHEKPAAEDLAGLLPVLQEFAWFARIDRERFVAGDPHAVAQAIEESRGRPEGELVSALVLRSMRRAAYRPVCEPHYGLASRAYLHFTSPIRRYPDLVVHRALKAQLFGRPEKHDQEVAALPWLAEHSSAMERVAEKAARESQEIKMAEYLQQFVGERFPAVVTGVASFGLYVQLENMAEGLIPVRELGDEYFAFDPTMRRLCGQDTGRVFRLGQRLDVVLVAADPRSSHLDFRLAH